MDYEVALLIFGILLLLLGLVGQVKAKEIEVGTSNSVVRIVATLVGVLFIVLSFDPDLPRSFLSGFKKTEEKPVGTGKEGSEKEPTPAPPAATPTPSPKKTPTPSRTPEQVCHDSIQNRVPWDYEGRKQWSQVNIDRLCKGTVDGTQPALCFGRVMFRQISWGGGTRWQLTNAIDLCEGTSDAVKTITCFRNEIRKGTAWPQATRACETR